METCRPKSPTHVAEAHLYLQKFIFNVAPRQGLQTRCHETASEFESENLDLKMLESVYMLVKLWARRLAGVARSFAKRWKLLEILI